MNNIFEKAIREKLRFQTNRGPISSEDLYALKIEDLANLGKAIKAQLTPLKEEDDEFSIAPAKENKLVETLELRLAIVKHVLDTKKTEAEAKKNRQAIESRRAELKALIEQKKGEADQGKSLDDLIKELEGLG